MTEVKSTEPRFRVLRVEVPNGEDHYIVQDTCGHWHISQAQAEELEAALNELSRRLELPPVEPEEPRMHPAVRAAFHASEKRHAQLVHWIEVRRKLAIPHHPDCRCLKCDPCYSPRGDDVYRSDND